MSLASMDVHRALAAALRQHLRDGDEWPVRDRRRLRNLLLDASTSDAMPLAELLLQAHDDGLTQRLPARTESAAVWATATARLSTELQARRFVQPEVARWVAEAWSHALGPDPVPTPVRTARPAAPRSAAPARLAPPPPAPPVPLPPTRSSTPSPAAMQQYRRMNYLGGVVALVFLVFMVLAFQSTRSRGAKAPTVAPAAPAAAAVSPDTARLGVAQDSAQVALSVDSTGTDSASSTTMSDSASAPTAADSGRAVAARDTAVVLEGLGRAPVAPAAARTQDDVVLAAGRVLSGRVGVIRAQTVSVTEGASGLEFEIAKADIERVVFRDGRVLRFGVDNLPVVGRDDDFRAVRFAGRWRASYVERWGVDREACRALARDFVPGRALQVEHVEGAPMMKLQFTAGQGFNSSVRADGSFETGVVQAPLAGPENSVVTTRISGRFEAGGRMTAVVLLTAAVPPRVELCQVALTLQAVRLP